MRTRGWVFENSLSVVFLLPFLASQAGQSLAGLRALNAEQAAHEAQPVSWLDYVTSSAFGQAVMESWQSEFLAVGTLAVFTIYLRQRGSPESKPVGAPYDETGTSG